MENTYCSCKLTGQMDGDSLLCLLGGGGCRGGKWRPHLDLEHYKVRALQLQSLWRTPAAAVS